jgi:hypothetical protein
VIGQTHILSQEKTYSCYMHSTAKSKLNKHCPASKSSIEGGLNTL